MLDDIYAAIRPYHLHSMQPIYNTNIETAWSQSRFWVSHAGFTKIELLKRETHPVLFMERITIASLNTQSVGEIYRLC